MLIIFIQWHARKDKNFCLVWMWGFVMCACSYASMLLTKVCGSMSILAHDECTSL